MWWLSTFITISAANSSKITLKNIHSIQLIVGDWKWWGSGGDSNSYFVHAEAARMKDDIADWSLLTIPNPNNMAVFPYTPPIEHTFCNRQKRWHWCSPYHQETWPQYAPYHCWASLFPQTKQSSILAYLINQPVLICRTHNNWSEDNSLPGQVGWMLNRSVKLLHLPYPYCHCKVQSRWFIKIILKKQFDPT